MLSHPQIWCGRVSELMPADVACSSLVQSTFPNRSIILPAMNRQEVHDMSNADLLRVLYMVLMEYLRRAGLYFRFNTPFALQFASDPTVVSEDSVGQVAQPSTPPAYFLCMHKCHKEHCHNSCLSRSQAPHIHVCPCHFTSVRFCALRTGVINYAFGRSLWSHFTLHITPDDAGEGHAWTQS